MKRNQAIFSLITLVAFFATNIETFGSVSKEGYIAEKKQQTMQSKLMEAVPLLLQNIRPYENISFTYLVEISEDGGRTWKPRTKNKLLLDLPQKRFLFRQLMQEETNLSSSGSGTNKNISLAFFASSFQNEKRTDYRGTVLGQRNLLQLTTPAREIPFKVKNASAGMINDTDIRGIMMSIPDAMCIWDFFFCEYGQSRHLSEIFQDSVDSTNYFQIENAADAGEFAIKCGSNVRYIIDKKTGIVKRKVSTHLTSIDKYLIKNGIFIPVSISMHWAKQRDGKQVYVPEMRISVNEESVKVNQVLSPEDFAIDIPAGTIITTGGRFYRLELPVTSATLTNTERQLDLLIQEARKVK